MRVNLQKIRIKTEYHCAYCCWNLSESRTIPGILHRDKGWQTIENCEFGFLKNLET